MAFNEAHLVTVGGLQQLASRTKTVVDGIKEVDLSNIKYVDTSNNTIRFFRNTSGTGDPAFTIDFFSELFLDSTKTTFVANFAFSAETYPNATNPNLEGEPVLVLAVKDTHNTRWCSQSTHRMINFIKKRYF